jgi:hypothetical protein
MKVRACLLALAAPCVGLALSAKSAAAATEVSGVEVAAGPPPKLAASFPAEGASVAAGVVVLTLKFDQVMAPKSWAYGRAAGADFPDCLTEPRLLADNHTFALLCTVAPNRSYAVEINPAPQFANSGGRTAKPMVLHFTTTGLITRDMHTALTQAGLTEADEPLMSWDDPGTGVSRSPSGGIEAVDQPAP